MIRLGLRLTLTGGREAAVRLVLLVTAVGLGVGLLLIAVAGVGAAFALDAGESPESLVRRLANELAARPSGRATHWLGLAVSRFSRTDLPV